VFEVPDAWLGREFTLTALGNQRFRFSGGGQRIVFDGNVGLRYRVPTPEGVIELKVDRMSANAGARFRLRRMSRLAMIQAIQNALVITEQGKQSGVIEVKLQGETRAAPHLLSEIGREYMRQNLARKTEEAEKSLAFLNQQLPILKRQLEQAEDRYNQFRNEHGTVDLQEEARMSLAASGGRAHAPHRADPEEDGTAGALHRRPSDRAAINRQRKEVEAEIEEVNARIKTLPVLEQDEARLTRDIKVNTDLYTALSNTAQQLRLISVGRVSNVRMVDAPMPPEKPLKPNRPLIVALAVVTGLFLGTLIAFARKAMWAGIDDPQKIERLLHARVVYATIPHSSNQDKLMRKAKGDGAALPLLASIIPEDACDRSLRSFRAALQFAMPHFRNNIVMFAGPTARPRQVLRVGQLRGRDGGQRQARAADRRRPAQRPAAPLFRRQPRARLSDAILGKMRVEDIIRHDVVENLDFIPTGELPPNRSEFLLHLNFGALLESGQRELRPGADRSAALFAGGGRRPDHRQRMPAPSSSWRWRSSGLTNEGEINESIKRLNQAGISPQGVLFNDDMNECNLSKRSARWHCG
jgi:tyrosine-protein kinase Etk/Wzc